MDPDEAAVVRAVFQLYLDDERLTPAVEKLRRRGWRNKRCQTRNGTERCNRMFEKNRLRRLIPNVTYLGKVRYGDRGCLSHFGTDPEAHRPFAGHVTSEHYVKTEGRDRSVHREKLRPEHSDHPTTQGSRPIQNDTHDADGRHL